MTNKYAGDSDTSYKRNPSTVSSNHHNDESEEHNAMMEKANDHIRELLGEKLAMDKKYPHADRLLDQEIAKTQQSGRFPQRDMRYVDIYREKPVRVAVKVLVPVKEHPKFNFVGKILGPKGNSLKRLQEETLCKIVVLGRGSMRDHKKEEELRESLDPKYAHLNDELHVEISTFASPAEAHARTAYALSEVRKYLIPDSNDDIRQEQLRELIADGTLPPDAADHKSPQYRGKSYPPKQKIMSILGRARSAMDKSYGYEEIPYKQQPPPPTFESHPYSHAEDYYQPRESYHPVKNSPTAARTPWKGSSGGYHQSNHHEQSNVKYSHGSYTREARYRSSPYARPEK